MVAQLNQFTRERAIREADESIKYLQQELANATQVELRTSIGSIIESQINKRMLATTRPEFSFKIIDPAQPPQVRRFVKPNRLVFIAAGVFIGVLCGFLIGARRSAS
jgi:flagellar hook assembly protein FlgD